MRDEDLRQGRDAAPRYEVDDWERGGEEWEEIEAFGELLREELRRASPAHEVDPAAVQRVVDFAVEVARRGVGTVAWRILLAWGTGIAILGLAVGNGVGLPVPVALVVSLLLGSGYALLLREVLSSDDLP